MKSSANLLAGAGYSVARAPKMPVAEPLVVNGEFAANAGLVGLMDADLRNLKRQSYETPRNCGKKFSRSQRRGAAQRKPEHDVAKSAERTKSRSHRGDRPRSDNGCRVAEMKLQRLQRARQPLGKCFHACVVCPASRCERSCCGLQSITVPRRGLLSVDLR